jgi:RND family efflux transporter MFP subunit
MKTRFSILAAALTLAACAPQPEQKAEEIRPVRVLKIGETPATRSFELAGEVRAQHETRLAFRVGGKIVERLVDVGALVRPGQPIARLDGADFALAAASAKAQVASAEAERELAAADHGRYKNLRERNFISQAEYDRRANALSTTEARLEALRAQHRQAANQAAYAVLSADTAGVITALEVEAGQVVTAGQTVARLARVGDKEIAIAIPESQREFIERAKDFSVTLSALPGKSWKGRLRELSPAADPATRTYAARVTVLDAGDDLEWGMSARVAAVANGGGTKIEVPVAALYAKGDQPQVLVVDGVGAVNPRAVQTAGIAGERVVIASGLNPGDVVVAAGAQLLRPGQRVRVIEGS